jgi:MYXO-CTERM domain-containing protein
MEKSDHSRLLRHTAGALVLGAVVACSAASSPSPEALATTSSDLAIGGLFSTGVNAAGLPLAIGTVDPHYVLSSSDAAFPGPSAFAVTANAAWTPSTATSRWISIQASTIGANNGAYTYTTTFPLSGGDPTTAALSGSWAADDSVTLNLNGTQVAQYPAEAYGAAAAFTVPAGSPFVSGSNTLAFVTINSGNGPTGLQVVTLTGTITGCTADVQCAAAQFCNTQTKLCTPKLANSTTIPTITGHTPPLTGVCAALVGAAVCVSGVCDAKDSECGYATGDGPCTVATGASLCQSGACSVSGICEPAGGCEADGDCTGGKWCDESTTTCTAKLANSAPVPSDPPHANPALNGTCTAAAGTLVCVSGVCDTKDNDCGYASGDGPCTAASGATVCRSGACSTAGVCEPMGGCETDADCTAGNWCDESTTTCTPKLANSSPVPNDPPHANPTLNGKCTLAAGALVCVSGVCDTKDSECGYANGDGPCTAASGATVCRSGACSSTSGVCEPAGGCASDADCSGGNWCDESTATCTPKLANGTSLPVDAPHMNPTLNGQCTPAAATLVCKSAVCDTKDSECGYANGDGPCTSTSAATVCRSGACSTNGTCEPTGGCNVAGDCPGGTCNTTTHTCQALPDAGMPNDGGADGDASPPADGGSLGDGGSSPDGAVSPGMDAGAVAPDAAETSGAYLDGGGLSCGIASTGGGSGPVVPAALAAMGLLAAARRRRSR